MSYTDISYALGYSYNYVSCIINNNKEKIDYVKTLDNDLLNGFRKLFQEEDTLVAEINEIYNDLMDRKLLRELSIDVANNNIYCHSHSAYTSLSQFVYSTREKRPSWKTFKKMKQIREIYNKKYKERTNETVTKNT